MESSDRKNVYLTKSGDSSLNTGMRDTMIVGQANMQPGTSYRSAQPCALLLSCNVACYSSSS